MSFLFASSHLPATPAQPPRPDEEDALTEPRSGMVRALSHLPQRAPFICTFTFIVGIRRCAGIRSESEEEV